MPSKILEIVAGPNGSGKTSFAHAYLMTKPGQGIYLNPDRIAGGISPIHFENASFQSGRILITEIKSRISQEQSFAFESTLSGKTWIPILQKAVQQNYQIIIYFLYLNSIKKNISRIKKRVRTGGHSIPTEILYRRHLRCFDNFWNLYRPLCTSWYLFNNSMTCPQLIQDATSFEKLHLQQQQAFVLSFLKAEIP